LFCAKKMETWCEPLTCWLICRDDVVIADHEKDRPAAKKETVKETVMEPRSSAMRTIPCHRVALATSRYKCCLLLAAAGQAEDVFKGRLVREGFAHQEKPPRHQAACRLLRRDA
jgi:hypothetical protein